MKRLIVIPWMLAAAAFVWVVVANIAPSGKFLVRYVPGEESPFFQRLGPSSAVASGEGGERLKDDRAFFLFRTPTQFDRANVIVSFEGNAPIVELRAATGPLEAERERKFLRGEAASPAPANVSAAGPVLPGFRIPLRGTHEFYFAPIGPADLTLTVQDRNRNAGADPIRARIIDLEGTLLAEAALPDDGNLFGNGVASESRALRLAAPHSSVLRLQFLASDDVYLLGIKGAMTKLAARERLFVADQPDERMPIPPIITDGAFLTASTPHREGFQTIRAGKEELSLQFTQERVTKRLTDKRTSIILEKPDVRLETDGFFAFGTQAFFAPLEPAPSWATTVPVPYEPDLMTTEFDLNALYRDERGRYRFEIVAPGLAFLGSELKIKEIKIELERPRWSFVRLFSDKIIEIK
ncbi:MAG: hypothetical protein AAB562_00950 [Patescibacteria group bacterium]